jgi:hypothetical protein
MTQFNKVFGLQTEQNTLFNSIEIYTKNPQTGEGGWDIEFVDVYANDRKQAKQILKEQHNLFDCVISF